MSGFEVHRADRNRPKIIQPDDACRCNGSQSLAVQFHPQELHIAVFHWAAYHALTALDAFAGAGFVRFVKRDGHRAVLRAKVAVAAILSWFLDRQHARQGYQAEDGAGRAQVAAEEPRHEEGSNQNADQQDCRNQESGEQQIQVFKGNQHPERVQGIEPLRNGDDLENPNENDGE